MLDPQLQARFTKSCTDAVFGYATAATAAYSDLFVRGWDFWTGFLSSAQEARLPSSPSTPPSRRLRGFAQPCAFTAPALGFPDTTSVNPFAAWNPWASFFPSAKTDDDPFAIWNPWTAFLPKQSPPAPEPTTFWNPWAAFLPSAKPSPSGSQTFWTPWAPMMATPWAAFMAPASAAPFNAWMDVMQGRGSAAAMPMAAAMMSAGVPGNVAWPTAEANRAALDAADLANNSVSEAFSSFRSGGGHASAPVFTDATTPVALALATVPVSLELMSAWLPFWKVAVTN